MTDTDDRKEVAGFLRQMADEMESGMIDYALVIRGASDDPKFLTTSLTASPISHHKLLQASLGLEKLLTEMGERND